MSAFDELERQLADSVAARTRVRGVSAGPIARWWRGRLRPGALVAAAALVAILVALGGPALAGRHGVAPREEASLGVRYPTGGAEGSCPPCRAVGGRLHAPLSEAEAAGGGPAPRAVLVRNGIPTVLW